MNDVEMIVIKADISEKKELNDLVAEPLCIVSFARSLNVVTSGSCCK